MFKFPIFKIQRSVFTIFCEKMFQYPWFTRVLYSLCGYWLSFEIFATSPSHILMVEMEKLASKIYFPGMHAGDTCNSSNWDPEEEGSQVQGHLVTHHEIFSLKKSTNQQINQ